jgi:GNAT superfamily N-acetyltransferase
VKIREITSNDVNWIRKLFIQRWGGDFIVSKGKIHKPGDLKGFIAETDKKLGLITFKITNRQLEIVSLDSFSEREGIGTSLLNEVIKLGKRKNLKKIWLTTTNDNVKALRFYQKRGFRIVRIYPNSVDVARKLKPNIPKIGASGITIRDEIELEMKL